MGDEIIVIDTPEKVRAIKKLVQGMERTVVWRKRLYIGTILFSIFCGILLAFVTTNKWSGLFFLGPIIVSLIQLQEISKSNRFLTRFKRDKQEMLR